MYCRQVVVALGLLAALNRLVVAASLTESFSTDPFAHWSFGIGATDPSTNHFVWNQFAPPAYTGDALGRLEVHLNSSLPTVRLQRPLGVIVTDTDDFTLTTRFSFNLTSAPGDQFMQIAFGLVNSALTGGDRTGTLTNFFSDNTFHAVEFNYFPNVSTFFGTGPTLAPAVFGAQIATNADAFANFISIFGPESDLGDNTNGVTSLPQNVTLQAVLAYTATNRTLTLTMSQVNSNGTLTLLDTGLGPLNLGASGYNTNFPFKVDALAIMAYQDGFTTTNDPSLIADLQFQEIVFTTSAYQPPSFVTINVISTNVVLTFPTLSNSLYAVQASTALESNSWGTIASNIVGTGGIVTNTDVGAAMELKRFYRVGLVVP